MLFTTHPLTEEEFIQGSVLTTLQAAVIQNRITDLATELVTTVHTKTDETYFEKVNYCKGQIAELQSMLDASVNATSTINSKED